MIYYIINISDYDKNKNVLVTVTPQDKGNPNLFLNEGTKLPTKSEYDMSSEDDGGDFI